MGLSQRQIVASCAVGQATVSEYLKAAETVHEDKLFSKGRRPSVPELDEIVPVGEIDTPRSSPCPCGSGRKYKRCCGVVAPPVLS